MSLKMGPGRAAAAPELNLHWQIRAAPSQDHGPNESGPPFSGGVGSTLLTAGVHARARASLASEDAYAMRMLSSRTWRSSTGDGAPVIRSEAVAVFGNAITSRI